MTDLDTREDDWARGVFDRAHSSHHEPHWIPDAASAACLSARHRRRTRIAGAAATTAVVVGVSATAFATLGGPASQPGRPAVAPGSTARPTPDPVRKTTNAVAPLTALSKYLSTGAASTGPVSGYGFVPPAAAVTLGTVLTGIDPTLAHVRNNEAEITPLRIDREDSGVHTTVVHAWGYWTPDGDISPIRASNSDPSKPFGYVRIAVVEQVQQIPGAEKDPCGLYQTLFGSNLPAPGPWSSCLHQTQSDGSVIISAHSVGLAAGQVEIAAREFPNGSAVAALTSSFIQYDRRFKDALMFTPAQPAPYLVAGRQLNPVPFTDDTLVNALKGPDVKGLP